MGRIRMNLGSNLHGLGVGYARTLGGVRWGEESKSQDLGAGLHAFGIGSTWTRDRVHMDLGAGSQGLRIAVVRASGHVFRVSGWVSHELVVAVAVGQGKFGSRICPLRAFPPQDPIHSPPSSSQLWEKPGSPSGLPGFFMSSRLPPAQDPLPLPDVGDARPDRENRREEARIDW